MENLISKDKGFLTPSKLFLLVIYNFLLFWIFLFKKNWGIGLTFFEIAHLAPSVLTTKNKSVNFYSKVFLAISLSFFFWLRADGIIRNLSLLTSIGLNYIIFQESQTGNLITYSYIFELPLIWITKFIYYTSSLWTFLMSWQNKLGKLKTNLPTQTIKRIIVGSIISLPLILILLILFSSADKNFSDLITFVFNKIGSIFNFDWLKNLNWIWDYIFQFSFFWVYLCLVFPYEDIRNIIEGKNISRKIEKLTIGTLVSGIFGIFILTQFKTISFILDGFATGKLNPGQFVREGFFQLIIASLIGITVFNVLKKEVGKAILTLTLLTEIFLVWIAAGERVALYEYVFGLTQARVWGSFALIFILTVIATLTLNLFKKISERSVWQIYIISFAAILGVAGCMNIDLFIAKFRPPVIDWKIDFNYMADNLSYDAAPFWIDTLNNSNTSAELKFNLIKNLNNYLGHLQDPYFRSTFNESFDITKFCDYKEESLLSRNFSIENSKKQICDNYASWMKWEEDYEFNNAKLNKTHSPVNLKVVSIDFSGYNAGYNLSQTLANDMAIATQYKGQGESAINYQIIATKIAHGSPKTKTAFGYNFIDYEALMKDLDICKINDGDIDEVWVWTPNSQGFSISGPDIQANDSEAFSDSNHAFTPCKDKAMTIMVFNSNIDRERFNSLFYMILKMDTVIEEVNKLPEMIRFKDGPENIQAARTTKDGKQIFACGSIFFPVNDLAHGAVTFNSRTKVLSDCDDWNYPGTGNYKEIDCTAWSCTDEGYAIWWMQHIPGLNNTLTDKSGKPMTNWWYAFAHIDDYKKILPSI